MIFYSKLTCDVFRGVNLPWDFKLGQKGGVFVPDVNWAREGSFKYFLMREKADESLNTLFSIFEKKIEVQALRKLLLKKICFEILKNSKK